MNIDKAQAAPAPAHPQAEPARGAQTLTAGAGKPARGAQTLTAGAGEPAIDKNSPEYQAAKGFEVHFMQEMMRNMRKTVPENPEMANNQGYHIFRDMLDDHYAETASRTQGIGLAEMIVKQLMEQQANARGHQPVAVRDVNKSDVLKK